MTGYSMHINGGFKSIIAGQPSRFMYISMVEYYR